MMLEDNPLIMMNLRKIGLYKVVSSTDNTMTVDIQRLYNVVFINRVTINVR